MPAPPPDSDEQPSPAQTLLGRRWLRRLLAVVAALVVVRVALPQVIVWTAEWQGRRALGRAVEVDDVDLALWRGAARIEGIRVGGALPDQGEVPPVDPATALLYLGQADVDLEPTALLRGEIRVRSVELQGPGLRMQRRADGSVTRIVLAAPSEAPADAEEEADDADAWPVLLDRLAVRNTRLELLDLTAEEPERLDFTLGGLSLDDLALAPEGVSLGGVALSEPKLRVRRELALGQEALVIGGAAEEQRSAAAPPAAEGPVDLGSYRIASLDIDRAEFVLLTDDRPLQVAISLALRDASLERDRTFPFEFGIEIEEGEHDGRLGVAGELGALPPVFRGTVEWSGLDFPLISTALAIETPTRVDSVLGSGSLEVDAWMGGLTGDGQSTVRLSGRILNEQLDAFHTPTGTRLTLDSVELVAGDFFLPLPDPGGEPVERTDGRMAGAFRVSGLVVENPELGLHAQLAGLEMLADQIVIDVAGGTGATHVELASVELREPVVAYTREAGPTKPAATAPAETAPAAETAEAAGPPDDASAGQETPAPLPELRIASLALRGGELEVTDRTVKPHFHSKVRNLEVSARDLRYPETEARSFDVSARGPGASSLRLKGGLGRDSADLDLALGALGLPGFNPYTTPAGYRLDDGALRLTSKIGLRGDRVRVDSKLVLKDLDLSSRDTADFQSRFGVPLDLGIALLQDPSGRISLPIRFTTQRGEVQAQLWPTILGALRQAFVGAVTLPLKALRGLGGLAGGDDDTGLALLTAEPGSAELTAEAGLALEPLAELLASRPRLALALHGHVGSEDEGPLRLQLLAEQVRTDGSLPEVEKVGFLQRRRIRGALKEHGAGAAEHLDEEDRAALDRLAAAVTVPPARREALARARASGVRDALVSEHGIAAGRVRVVAVDAGEPGVTPELASVAALGQDSVASEADRPAVGAGPPGEGG